MCNSLHSDSVPISKTGYGWKIVIKGSNKEIISPVDRASYLKSKGGIITWTGKEVNGFCFFLKKKEAIRTSKAYDWMRISDARQIVVKIRYFKGMGKHIETYFISGHKVEIALCKKFQFIK